MAETLVQFQTPVVAADGTRYEARACGAENADGLWEGWVEFTPVGGGKTVRSPRETTQPNRRDAEYWGTGLSAVYLEGALKRALKGPATTAYNRIEPPVFARPAPALAYTAVPTRESALDPFSVYAKGELLLRKQLGALSGWHLVNIAQAYGLTEEPVESLNRRSTAYLIEVIVTAVRERQEALGR